MLRSSKLLTLLGSVLVVATLLAVTATAQRGPGNSLPDVSYTLTTGLADGKMAFIGVGGEIDEVTNPPLQAEPGDLVQITLINGDGVQHDLLIEELGAQTDMVVSNGASSVIAFRVDEEGTFDYYCTVPGHRQAGMEGILVVGEGDEAGASELPSVVRSPTDLPGPMADRGPVTHDVTLETIEVEAALANGVSYRFWTFNGKIPGPFLRVKVGDTVNVTLENAAGSTMVHSVDFHAVTGPGGGAVSTQTKPGDGTSFTFEALNPGLYVYHCATPMVAHHITNGMYGLILVEPEEGLEEVDREFYVMQGELYTEQPFGAKGPAEMSVEKLLDEDPEYYTFNGAVGGLTAQHPLTAEVGDTVRIYFGVGGPNKSSAFHVIGEIFDKVYDQGSLTTTPLTDVQTTTVAPGGAVAVEFSLDVPGRYILVDHALSRLERGLAGFLEVTGEAEPGVYEGATLPGSGH